MNVGNKITQKPHSSWVSFYPIIQLFFRCGIPYFCKKTVLFYKHGISDEKEEERYRQLDAAIRSTQKSGKSHAEAAATKLPFFRKKRFGKSGKKLF
jgi:hypothetical protein